MSSPSYSPTGRGEQSSTAEGNCGNDTKSQLHAQDRTCPFGRGIKSRTIRKKTRLRSTSQGRHGTWKMTQTHLYVFPSVRVELFSAGCLAILPSFGPSISDLRHTTSPDPSHFYPSQFWQLKTGLVSILDLLKLTPSQNITLIRYTKMTMTLIVRTERGERSEKNTPTSPFHKGNLHCLCSAFLSFFHNYFFYFIKYFSTDQSSKDYLQGFQHLKD